ncbi:helix-turn-helix domain-containing protein [Leifsonia sp. ZF2019]|uniref:GlxA family transcriptional regulator n=1 Tax=Leifsonia sp. ZF2019 TaxID=2781978 RepID=UPI001CBF291D|nr:helix-turn-helix domain-containing protein [Leifsonia sp. ZF2019]UAJ79495.1 helix-turn-helix domain-containing protein [Leifsonia sp. ZF2019]
MEVLFIALPDLNLLDLSGPAQVFSAASALGADYRLRWVGEASRVVSAQGLALDGLEPLAEAAADENTLVVVPGVDLGTVLRRAGSAGLVAPEVLEWTRRAHAAGARLASVCTGAVVLGDAGLLDGRRCTTHWSAVAAMRERYPEARVLDDVLFVHDGSVSTSAGIASGIDLALALVEADRGPAFAASVARELVVYTRRNGSSAPTSPFLAHRDHLDPVVHAVQDTLASDLAGDHPLAELAARAHLSPRGLSRAFVAATGLTPAQYHTELRLGHARTLLRASTLTIEEIARACGYADPRHFRRMFGTHEGVSPSAYRLTAA